MSVFSSLTGSCDESSNDTSQDSTLSGRLDVMDMLGVFIVLYAGIVLGILTVFIEWFVASWLEASKKHPDVSTQDVCE